jgi:hypothetical protein
MKKKIVIPEIVYYTPVVPGENVNNRMMGECLCDFECYERGDSVCQAKLRRPMTITVDWGNVRDTEEYAPWRRMIEVAHLIPTRWPKGQAVLDRMYWCCAGIGQSTEGSNVYDWRLSGLLDSAIALLGGRR